MFIKPFYFNQIMCRPRQRFLCKNECDTCFERSFASHEKSEFWNVELNSKIVLIKFGKKIDCSSPRNITKSNNNKFWFKCPDCKHDFNAQLNNITKGHWCPYCANRKLCNDCEDCFNKSFESSERQSCWHPTKNNKVDDKTGKVINITPRQVFKQSNDKFWFTCDKCNHDFNSSLDNIAKGQWCPYCANQKLCNDCEHCYNKSFASSERKSCWHPTKNKLNPRQVFKNSHDKYWFTCPDCKHNFCASLGSIAKGQWCPKCKNKTEKKLYEYLLTIYPEVKHQFRPDWCRNPKTGRHLPFDFVIQILKIIIELDGAQHFMQVRNWQSPEEQQSRDLYKMKKANENGYTVIRLLQEDVWNDTNNWQEELIKMLNKEYDKPECVFIAEGTEYECYLDSDDLNEDFSDEISDDDLMEERFDEVMNKFN